MVYKNTDAVAVNLEIFIEWRLNKRLLKILKAPQRLAEAFKANRKHKIQRLRKPL